jgi:hypothetical protein
VAEVTRRASSIAELVEVHDQVVSALRCVPEPLVATTEPELGQNVPFFRSADEESCEIEVRRAGVLRFIGRLLVAGGNDSSQEWLQVFVGTVVDLTG